MATVTDILEVSAGDVVIIGTSYFKVMEVRDPRHPAMPGVVWEGCWFLASRGGIWSDQRPLNITENSRFSKLEPELVKKWGWDSLV